MHNLCFISFIIIVIILLILFICRKSNEYLASSSKNKGGIELASAALVLNS